ncbi:hypothetical protein Pth03_78280 [Planotetraspora thailandica]|uniref:Holin n=1 Tax=Planotetraspora thailandica TaxID=487172 RepID=A0A8J3Y277_9ACTN|nr:hypothetical protein [Planotetraspora thailandica]GII59439.1 hypothetical protein Pth03_78280 [Planotetraspora thailandica]
MGPIEAAGWGLAGGAAAGLVSLSVAVTAASFRRPWKSAEELMGRLFVLAVGAVLGALVAAAASQQMSGPWPAFIMGVGAPSMVQSLLARVEVTESKRVDAETLGGGDDNGARKQ